MNNEFAFLPCIDIDIQLIQSIVLKNLHSNIPGLATHHRRVEDDDYLISLKKKYTFLSSLYNIYETKQSYNTPVHVDSARNCALNIPVANTLNSHTVFYKFVNQEVTRDIKDRVYNIVESNVEEVFRFTLVQPTVINTAVPHGVFDHGSDTRVIMSWSISNHYDYNSIRNMLSS